MESDHNQPLNIGSDRLVTIKEFADIISKIAGKKINYKYTHGPQGVRGRNSDNTKCWQVLGWVPQIPLEEGMRVTYEWIKKQLIAQGRISVEKPTAKETEVIEET